MTSTSVPGHEEPSSWHVYTSSIESWFTLDNIRSIVSPFEKGVAPQHMVALVIVNFIGLFAHFAKSVFSERRPLVVASRFLIYTFLLAVPALFFPVVFFVGFSAVVLYNYSNTGQIHVF